VRLPIERVAALLDHGERFMAHLSLVRHSLARLDDAAELRRADAALAEAVAALGVCLDIAAPDELAERQTAAAVAAAADDVDLLPAQPPTADVVPWLARRLAQLVREATDIRAAAQASLAAAE
jgi:hypothetical protein